MYRQSLVLAFDGDSAGHESARRYVVAAARLGHAAAVTSLPGRHDPASWLAETGDDGLEAWALPAGLDPGRQLPKLFPARTCLATALAPDGVLSDPSLLVRDHGATL